MHQSGHITRHCFLVFTAAFLLAPVISPGGERELWSLWKKHLEDIDNHAGMVNNCRKYAAALPEDSFLPVVRGIEAWHLLHEGKKEEAIQLLSPQLEKGNGALERGTQRLARGWMTRLQSEQVVDALQFYYRKEVRYPNRLEELAAYPGLPGAENVPLKDAWERPWRYRLTGFGGVSGFRDQKYSLESGSVQEPMNPDKALALPYAAQIDVQPSRVAAGDNSVLKLEFLSGANKGKNVVGQLGEDVEGITVAYAGTGLVILCDSLHWKVLTWK